MMRTRSAGFALAALSLCLVQAGSASAAEGVTDFVSAPKLKPPTLTVNTSARGQSPGYIFIASFQNKFLPPPRTGQGGPMIVDNKGHYVYLRPNKASAPDTLNFQVQRYQGKPVLTYWDGTVKNTGEMVGTWHVLNDRYREIAKVLTGQNGWDPSGHEFNITKAGTALVTGYKYLPHRNLTSMGGGEDQTLLDSGVLEFDIKTGKLIKEWSADQHIPMDQSYSKTSPQNPNAFDPWHINSIDVDSDGNWLVSMRNTWAIYKIDSKTGQILWTLGGKASSFAVPDNVAWAFQHDARWRSGGKQISIFDNDCCRIIPQPSGPPQTAPPEHGTQSRGLVMNVDETNKAVSFASDRKLYTLTSGTQGNMQILPSGNAFMGWGQQPFFSEFSKTGKLLLSIRLPDPDESYRAYRYTWTGNPTGRPSVAAVPSKSKTRVYVSWNGATKVAAYRVFAGPSSRKLKVVAKRVTRQGFETSALLKTKGPIVRVQALDSKGRVLGTSRAVRRQNTTGTEPAPSY